MINVSPSGGGQFLEARELLFDDIDGRLIGQFERFLVEFLRRERHEDFRLAEQMGIDRGQALRR
jgi:hypothetical protein